MDTNLKAGLIFSQQVVPEMKKRKGGSIIFITSVAAYYPYKVV